VEQLVHAAAEVRARFEEGTLRRYARDAGAMLSLVEDYWSGADRESPYWTVAVITFTLQYVLKPIDIIPDVLPVIGKLDDAVVFGHGLALVRADLEAHGR
jgi:uncharacterized membrane protein YkvA (DUF1232 family)